MRILVENSGYDLDNLGDVCMLQVLFGRLRACFPRAEFRIITRDRRRLALYCEGSRAVPAERNLAWRQARNFYTRLRRGAPSLDSRVLGRMPVLRERLLRFRARHSVAVEKVRGAELLVVAGGGFLTDVFRGQAWSVLERLDASRKGGAPFALFGQGLGPLRDPSLLEKARAVLPAARLIAVRERLMSLPLLERLGVARERVLVTGDDALEPAYLARREETGECVGVNLRVAAYARVGREMVGALRGPLQEVAGRLKSTLVALPISVSGVVESASDVDAAEALISGPWASVLGEEGPRDPRAIIARVGKCRVVVTGSYHAAVFALGQGIPAICLANSEYYEGKFRGLADQFGEGVEVLGLSDGRLREQLIEKTLAAWEQAETLRPRLLRAAERQVRAGRAAYERLRELFEARG